MQRERQRITKPHVLAYDKTYDASQDYSRKHEGYKKNGDN